MNHPLLCRLRLTSAGWRIDELVNTDEGWYITWPGLYTERDNAAREVARIRPDVDQKLLIQCTVRQDDATV